MIRVLVRLVVPGLPILTLLGCGPSYSPDTYANNAAQQAAKVEAGVIAGVRPVKLSAQGTTGAVAGAAAGGVAGSQVGAGPTSAFGAIGGSLIGGLAGVTTEHIIGDADGFEYIVRKANGEMISVAQKDAKPLWVGERVLVIAGPQARVVADYTVPYSGPTAAGPGAPVQPQGADGAGPRTSPGDADRPSHSGDGVPAAHQGDTTPLAHSPVAEVRPAVPVETRSPAPAGATPSGPPPVEVPVPAPPASTPKP